MHTNTRHPACHRRRAQAAAARPASFYSRLKAELDSIGWRHVSSLSDDLSHLKLVATDVAGRRHELRLTLPPAYPATPPVVAADLPAAFEPRWAAGSGLADVLQQFEAALALHQLAWDSLDDLDRHAWVIEPTAAPRRWAACCHRSRSVLGCPAQLPLKAVLGLGSEEKRPRAHVLHTRMCKCGHCALPLTCVPCPLCSVSLHSVLYRRIALGSHVSLALTLDVQHPGLVPLDCRFMGSKAAVAPLR